MFQSGGYVWGKIVLQIVDIKPGIFFNIFSQNKFTGKISKKVRKNNVKNLTIFFLGGV
ncbi:MAG: hypothetical protein PHW24_02025 [Candidatus Moranbacteria bacterium]|nr:hypothetical protein [Candidatus Moranbacteria bacterium]